MKDESWKDGKKFFNGQSACLIHSPIIDHDNDDTLSNVIAACSVQRAECSIRPSYVGCEDLLHMIYI